MMRKLALQMTRALAVVFAALTAPLFAGPAAAAELIMVEEHGCVWCARWDSELSAIYPKTPEGKFAPLRRVQKHQTSQAEISFTRPVSFTPTFVLVEDGHEVGRIEGYPGEDFFWGLLGRMLAEQTRYEESQG